MSVSWMPVLSRQDRVINPLFVPFESKSDSQNSPMFNVQFNILSVSIPIGRQVLQILVDFFTVNDEKQNTKFYHYADD